MAKNKIGTYTLEAMSNIGWLATTYIIVNSLRFNIAQYTDALLNDPNILQISNYPPTQAEEIRNKIIGYLKEFYQPIKGHGIPGNFGHRQNKAAIFGVDAILQTYLDDMYEAVASAKNLAKANLLKRSIFWKVDEIEKEIGGISLQNLSTAKHAFFIGQMRHLITHRNGDVDKDFLKTCGIDMNTLKLGQGKSPLWDTKIWPTEKEFLAKFQPPKSGKHFQLNLAIENVVLPYLHHASEFVDEVLLEFKRIV
ncbi:MAG: hypothetical protein HQ573_04065 [Desulfobacteraceae bacterium]|nr:hypothetical protein [Desulfobacteraceae bacterium]